MNIINRIFFRWSKWEIYKEDLPYKMTMCNDFTGFESRPTNVLVDIYVKTNLYTGLKKYKKIIKR